MWEWVKQLPGCRLQAAAQLRMQPCNCPTTMFQVPRRESPGPELSLPPCTGKSSQRALSEYDSPKKQTNKKMEEKKKKRYELFLNPPRQVLSFHQLGTKRSRRFQQRQAAELGSAGNAPIGCPPIGHQPTQRGYRRLSHGHPWPLFRSFPSSNAPTPRQHKQVSDPVYQALPSPDKAPRASALCRPHKIREAGRDYRQCWHAGVIISGSESPRP